jgi:hypothetical protein
MVSFSLPVSVLLELSIYILFYLGFDLKEPSSSTHAIYSDAIWTKIDTLAMVLILFL